MKLLRYGPKGFEKPGLLDNDGNIRDLSEYLDDFAGIFLSDEALAELREIDPSEFPVVDASVRLGPCVGKVGKFICIGLNYADHAAESGMALPDEPVIFFKATSSIIGANDQVEIPRKIGENRLGKLSLAW